jgi:ankyrin repeat protein
MLKHGIVITWFFITIAVVIVTSTTVCEAAQGKTSLEREFVDAALNNNKQKVELFIEAGIDVNAKDFGGRTGLYLASMYGHTEIVKLLLDKGADANLPKQAFEGHTDGEYDGHTALYVACKRGHTEVVKLLLAKGADVNAKDYNGNYALLVASQGDKPEIVKLLLDKGADVKAKFLGDPRYFRAGDNALFVAMGTNLSYTHELSHTEEIVKLLLDKGADANAKNGKGYPALFVASMGSNATLVKLLLDKGADVHAKFDSDTVLHTAATSPNNNNIEIVKLLLAKGADVNARNSDGWTALMLAKKNRKDFDYLLIKAGGGK